MTPQGQISMNNSENHATIYHKQNCLLPNLNMMIVIERMLNMLYKTDHYLNKCINYLDNYLHYHSFFGVRVVRVSLKKNQFLGGNRWGEARFPPYPPCGGNCSSPLTPPCSFRKIESPQLPHWGKITDGLRLYKII